MYTNARDQNTEDKIINSNTVEMKKPVAMCEIVHVSSIFFNFVLETFRVYCFVSLTGTDKLKSSYNS